MQANKELAGDRFRSYRNKRSPNESPEPAGRRDGEGPGVFVVQKHAARNTHFDFRLEWNGVLLSWAVPKGPSLETYEKRLAVQTEDHPLEYAEFEGVIPKGNYGAGAMIVWDKGRWIPLEEPEAGLEKGKLLFELKGYKLRGVWTLVRTQRDARQWLLIKKPDQWSKTAEESDCSEVSVLSGITVEELEEGSGKAARIRRELDKQSVPLNCVSIDQVGLMLAESETKPFNRKGWLFELKYDGYRLLASREEGRVRLRYRSGRDATKYFPEISRSIAALPFSEYLLDGEVVVTDEEGKPDFQLLQKRTHRDASSKFEQTTLELPATLWVFDLLGLEGHDLRPLPLRERKALLRRMLPEVGSVRYADHLEERGSEFFDQVVRLGLEGIVAKEAISQYKPGRHRQWLKIHASSSADFAVVGFTQPKKSRAGFGALHLAGFEGSNLIYVGSVGTGFSQTELMQIREKLDQHVLSGPPCSGVPVGKSDVWVEPNLVATVRFKEWTHAGRMRQPIFLGLRNDKPCEECYLPTNRSRDTGVDLQVQESASTGGRVVELTNQSKMMWPEQYTKKDLIEYYGEISPWVLPYLRDRLVVLDRYPDGILGKSFFQKNAPDFVPEWIRTEQLWSKDATSGNNYFVVDGKDSLQYLANLASIPLHIWSSRVETLQFPDWCILDLDPLDVPFQEVVDLAQVIRTLCEEYEIDSYAKTSGGKGLHILIPLGAQYSFEQGRLLAELLARLSVTLLPEIATIDRSLEKRSGKIYIDYLQNGYGKLLVAPFSLRPFEGAPVSMPLCWEEVTNDLDPLQFNLKSVPQRMNRLKEDPLCGILRGETDLIRVLSLLGEKIRDMV